MYYFEHYVYAPILHRCHRDVDCIDSYTVDTTLL